MKKFQTIFCLVFLVASTSFATEALLQAVIRQEYLSVKSLLERGVTPNWTSPDGVMPIDYATGDYLILLLRHGARTEGGNRGDYYAPTPLMRAAGEGRLQDVQALLEAGADPRLVRRNVTARGWLNRRVAQRTVTDAALDNVATIRTILQGAEELWDAGEPIRIQATLQRIAERLMPAAPAVVGTVVPTNATTTRRQPDVEALGIPPVLWGGSEKQATQ